MSEKKTFMIKFLILKKENCQTETMFSMLVWIRLCLILILNNLMPDVLQKMVNDAKEKIKENFNNKASAKISSDAHRFQGVFIITLISD